MYEGGFISLDTSAGQTTKKSVSKLKSTWYKADMDPCVGTSLYLEVPLMGEKGVPDQVASKSGLSGREGSLQLKRQHSTTQSKPNKKTLVLNPFKTSSNQNTNSKMQ